MHQDLVDNRSEQRAQLLAGFQPDNFIPHDVKHVFYVALPLFVVHGLGIGVDFYTENCLWSYIEVFWISES